METAKQDYPLPLVHLGGNSRDRLQEYYTNALYALQEQALVSFNKVDFHPRDYYPLDDDPYSYEAYNKALAERTKMLEAFKTIQGYLEKHIAHLYETE